MTKVFLHEDGTGVKLNEKSRMQQYSECRYPVPKLKKPVLKAKSKTHKHFSYI